MKNMNPESGDPDSIFDSSSLKYTLELLLFWKDIYFTFQNKMGIIYYTLATDMASLGKFMK